MNKRFKPVSGFEGRYSVSCSGEVYSLRRDLIMSPQFSADGYPVVALYKKEGVKLCKVHRLVARAFVENSEGKEEVNHIDGNKTNNLVVNLEWVTRSENLKHAYRTGLACNKGTNNPQSKVTEKEVREIRRLKKEEHFSLRDLAIKYNIARSTVSAIVNYKTWVEV